MSKTKIKFLLKIIGLLILVYILSKIDYKLLWQELSQAKIIFLVLAIIATILEIITKSLRWQVILKSLGINVAKKTSIRLHWLGLYAGVITPGRVGEIIKVYFLKLRNHNAFRSFLSVVIDRFFDVATFLILGSLVAVFFLREISLHILALGGIIILGFVFILLLLNKKSFVHKIAKKIITKFSTHTLENYSQFTFKKLWQGIKNLKAEIILRGIFYWFLSFLFFFLAKYFIALALSIEISFANIIIVSTALALVSALPISIAGLGTRDAASIYLFSLFAISKETAILFSMLILLVDLIAVSFGLIPYLQESNKIKSAKNELKNS